MTEIAKQTEVYAAVNNSDGSLELGLRLFPPQSQEEYQALGSRPVVDGDYVHAVSLDRTWSIHDPKGEQLGSMPQTIAPDKPNYYRQLAGDVEAHLGRTGLTVLVS